jgi:sialate O-acetylesterase
MKLRPLPASLALSVGLLGAASVARAELRVSSIVGEHMVLEQRRPFRISGTDAAGQSVRVALGAVSATAKADASGRWEATLAVPPAGGPFTLTVTGSETRAFGDVWSGEVWLASGQSNMELPLHRSTGAVEATAGGCAGMRLFLVDQKVASAPAAEPGGKWQACDANTAAGFSAVAFHFGRELHRALGVPVGLIQAAWGGTPAEAWTPRATLTAEPSLRPMVDELDRALADPSRRAELDRKIAEWERKSFHQDVGNRGEARGFARGRGDGWQSMDLPRLWESAGLAIDGAVWFKREVTIPPEWAGRDLTLALGAIDDFDVTYWNGDRVGAIGAETPQYYAARRRYTVPGRLVKAGKNLVAVRVFDHYGSGGFSGTPAELTVGPAAPGSATVSLAGTWLYKIERKLPLAVVDWGTRPRAFAGDDPQSPSLLWNGMVAPFAATGVQLAGVIWYQGEANVGRAVQYRTLFPAMIRAWRTAFGAPSLPFLYVQLPNFEDRGKNPLLGEGEWAELREAQAAALREPATAMAVTLDIGESGDIHPTNKQDVGRRLALAALRLAYGADRIASGPVFVTAARDGRAMRVRFASIASGLATADGGPPRGFLVAGADRAWHRADARIDGSSVVVSSPEVPDPVAVRYGWGNDPPNTLRNLADLPAAPFRTDDWSSAPVAASPR